MNQSIKLAVAFGCVFWGAAAQAQDFNCTIDDFMTAGNCLAPDGNGSGEDTQAYLGLVWEFGAGTTVPAVQVGVRSLEAASDGNVSGADLAARVRLGTEVGISDVRLSYVGGKSNLLANIGVGYAPGRNEWFAIGALQTQYARVGADYGFTGGSLSPFAELNTLKMPTYDASCDGGSELITWDSGNPDYDFNPAVEDEIFAGGEQTCYRSLGDLIG